MNKDFYIHLDETLNLSVQLLDIDGSPINMATADVNFAVSKEQDRPTIAVLSSANSQQVSVSNANAALIDVYFKPIIADGFDHGTHVYQLKVDTPTTSTMYMEGRIFIQPSLFD